MQTAQPACHQLRCRSVRRTSPQSAKLLTSSQQHIPIGGHSRRAFIYNRSRLFLRSNFRSLYSCRQIATSQGRAQTPSPTPSPTPPPSPSPTPTPLPPPTVKIDAYRAPAGRIIGAALTSNKAYERLSYLTDRIGNRLSGSASLERAIAWALAEMKRDGLDNVRGEKVMVPHWVRGEESLEMTVPLPQKLVDAGIRKQCRHASGGNHGGSSCRAQLRSARRTGRASAREDRRLQRAVYKLRRHSSLSWSGRFTRRPDMVRSQRSFARSHP